MDVRALRRLDAEAGLTPRLAMLQAVNARELIRAKQVEPSILSADYSRLGEQLATVMDAGARVIHVDVMDGHFVPPITIGPVIVESIRDQVHEAGGMLDCHLMVERPERQIEQFAAAGADSITIQVEATPNVHYALQQIRDAGCLAGLAINPGTPVEAVAELARPARPRALHDGEPGLGRSGVHRDLARQGAAGCATLVGADLPIQVDGGIGAVTAGTARATQARRCSSPARRSSARPTRPRPTARSRRPRRALSAASCPRRRRPGSLPSPRSSRAGSGCSPATGRR